MIILINNSSIMLKGKHMKKNIFLIAAVLSFSLSTLVSAQTAVPSTSKMSDKFELGFLLGVGNTFFGNDLSQSYGAAEAAGMERLTLNVILGLQTRMDVTDKLKIGVEMNFSHWLNETAEQENHPMAVDQDAGFCYHGLHMLGLMEFRLSELIRLQAGFGMYATLTFNDQFGSKYGGSAPFFMIASGVDIPFGEDKSIPITLRVTTLETLPGNFGTGSGLGSMIAITLMSGVNFRL